MDADSHKNGISPVIVTSIKQSTVVIPCGGTGSILRRKQLFQGHHRCGCPMDPAHTRGMTGLSADRHCEAAQPTKQSRRLQDADRTGLLRCARHDDASENSRHPVRRHGIHAAAKTAVSRSPSVRLPDGSRACAQDDDEWMRMPRRAASALLGDDSAIYEKSVKNIFIFGGM
jgi:hypothetical protein